MGIGAGAASAAIGLVGAGVSAYGAMEQGQAEASQASYQAQVARNNQIAEQQNARAATAAGEEQATTESLKNAAQFGSIKAAEGADNVDVDTGSNMDVQKSQRELGELDTSTVLNNAMLQAYGYQTQATSYGAQAGLENTEAAEAPIGADIGAAGGLLANASSVGFKWSGMNSNPSNSGLSAGDSGNSNDS